MERRTAVFVDTGRWTCFDQLASTLRRSGVRAVRVTTEQGRLSTLMSRLDYGDCIVAEDLTVIAEALHRIDLQQVIDVHCTEATLAAVVDALQGSTVPESVRARLDWQRRNLDKYDMSQRLRAAGVPVPATSPAADGARAAFERLGLPVVVKGRVGAGGTFVAVAADVAEAEAAVARFGGGEATYYEQFIAGDNIRYSSCRQGGAPSAEATFVVRRRDPGSLGPATGVELVDDPAMVAVGRAALEAIGAEGLSNVEAMRASDGTLYVIDMNLRVWGSAATLSAAGVDFPRAYAATLGVGPTVVAPLSATAAASSGMVLEVFPDSAMALVENGSMLLAAAVFAAGALRYTRTLGLRYLVAAAALFAVQSLRHAHRAVRGIAAHGGAPRTPEAV